LSVFQNSALLRTKMLLILFFAFAASVGSVLALGITTFTDDKVSHLLDYQLTQVQVSADAVEKQIHSFVQATELMHLYIGDSNWTKVEHLFRENSQLLHLKKILILQVDSKGNLKKLKSFGDEEESLVLFLEQFGWDGFRFLNDPLLIGKDSNGELVIGNLIRSTDSGGTAFLSVLSPDVDLTQSMGDFKAFLFGAMGNYFSSNPIPYGVELTELTPFLESILDHSTQSGVRKWSSKHHDFFVSYQRLKHDDLLMVGMMSEKDALSTVRRLLFRSIVLSTSILLIFLGLTLLFLHKMASGLKSLILVLDKMKDGEFSLRVNTSSMANDEIGSLATSINLMAERVYGITENAKNEVIRSHQEEVITSVQKDLFLKEPLKEKQVQISGRGLAASPFGGDWWHYEKMGEYVFLIVCEMADRGVQAGILTAAIRGAISIISIQSRFETSEPLKLKTFVQHLNATLYEIFRGEKSVTCFMALMNTTNGVLEMMNADHSVPHLYRVKSGRFELLPVNKSPALGTTLEGPLDPDLFQLISGDLIFSWSTGLFKILNSAGETLNTAKMIDWVQELYIQAPDDANKISLGLTKKTEVFFGETSKNPPIDMSFLVLTIPNTALFAFSTDETVK
jgi:serine phosphatase RsbU (regulator of sigma subunit)